MSTQFSKCRWTLAIHGGAGSMRRGELAEAQEAGATAGLNAALDAGAAVLETGGSAVEAVQAAVQVLEDDPHFNAGRGSVFTWEGGHTLDAAIMDGASRAAGAVAGSTTTRHPVALARAVMEKTPHVLLAGGGAASFAFWNGFAPVADPQAYYTPAVTRPVAPGELAHGTVGAVAKDKAGRLAAATSTGGLLNKLPGRVGDCPLTGAGTWADARCAVSCTGQGELFIRANVAADVSARMAYGGQSLRAAAAGALADMETLGGDGGLIAVDADGNLAAPYTSEGMKRALATAGGLREVKVFR